VGLQSESNEKKGFFFVYHNILSKQLRLASDSITDGVRLRS